MPYRSDEEAWVRRSEDAEARAQVAEAALRELASMKAKTPWRQAWASLVLVCLGAAAGWYAPPPEHRPGSFTALSTQALAAHTRSRYTWRAAPTLTTPLAAVGEDCELSVDARDNDGMAERSAREIYVRLRCSGRLLHSTAQASFSEHRIGGCTLEAGALPSLFCSVGRRLNGQDGVAFFLSTNTGRLSLRDNDVQADFVLSSVEHTYESPRPLGRGASTFESGAAITYVSGIPSDGSLPRPRVRVGAACQVMARSADGARESQCEVEIDCAGTHFEASGACALDDMGQIERVVDLTLSSSDQRSTGNASVIFDVAERQLLLMDDNGYEAFLIQLSLESSRSRARFL